AAQERTHHEMSRIHEKHMPWASACLFQQRFQLGFQEFGVGGSMFFDGLFRGQWDGAHAPPFQAKHFSKKACTCVGPRSMPVSSLMRRQASATVWGGCRRNNSSKESRWSNSSLVALPQFNFRTAWRPP